jgi:predicted  nucleic acid-binding Zn-ribbon protein
MPDVKNITEELNSLQKEIDSAKKNAAIFEGRIQESMKRLKDDFGLKTIAEASKKAEELKSEISILEEEIFAKFKELKETYAW